MSCAASILVGGAGRRMGGAVKPLLEVGGRRILDRQLEVLSPLFEQVRLVGGPSELFAEFGLSQVEDLARNVGPIAGVEAALASSSADFEFIFAGDLPYLSGALIEDMRTAVTGDPSIDLLLPVAEEFEQPLHAAYSPRTRETLRQRRLAGQLALRGLAQCGLNCLRYPVFGLCAPSPFHNVNHTSDLD